MSLTVVNLRLNPAFTGQYEVWLIGSGALPAGGLDIAGNAVIPRRVASGKLIAGLATVSLQPTSEVTPAGTVYRADLHAAGARHAEQLVFTVPVSATAVDATDYITDSPGALPSSALGAHAAAVDPHALGVPYYSAGDVTIAADRQVLISGAVGLEVDGDLIVDGVLVEVD